MREQIEQFLIDIEQQHNVTILYACETGSRAAGLAGPTSDYDVRFLFRHPREEYLRLDTPLEVIKPTYDQIDLEGWELRKALRLFHKSNPMLLEWLQAHEVYRPHETLPAFLFGLAEQHYAPITIHCHYLNTARNTFNREIRDHTIKVALKSYLKTTLFLLKALFRQQTHSLPPNSFLTLVHMTTLPEPIFHTLIGFASYKRAGARPHVERDPVLDHWIIMTIALLDEHTPTPTYHPELRPILDDLFLHSLD